MAGNEIPWEKVKSTNIARVYWTPDKRGIDSTIGRMYVVFHTGWLYLYFDVPGEVYDAFMDAPDGPNSNPNVLTKGKFHHQHIKWKFDYAKLKKV